MEHAISLEIDVQPIFSTLMPLLDPADPRPIHLVGIAGAGMSALAELFLLRGARVTGCDAHPENAPDLVARGVEVLAGHSADHVAGARAKGMTPQMFDELVAVTALANATNRIANGYRIDVDERFK